MMSPGSQAEVSTPGAVLSPVRRKGQPIRLGAERRWRNRSRMMARTSSALALAKRISCPPWPAHHPAGIAEGAEDVLPLGVRQRDRRGGRRLGRRDRGLQVPPGDLQRRTWREDDRACQVGPVRLGEATEAVIKYL